MNYIQTHWNTWITLKSPEALWRIASAEGWLLPGEDSGSDLDGDRIQALEQKARALAILNKRGCGRHV
jgi:hypothetical protein